MTRRENLLFWTKEVTQMKGTYKAVFFDFDYTLGDASECIVAGFLYAFERMGLPRPEERAVRATIGMTLENAYTLLTGDERPEERQRFHQLYVEKANPLQVVGTKFFPGALEILDWLKGQGVIVAIVSTKRRSVIEAIFAHRKIEDKLDFVVGGTDVPNYKPAPDAALLALSKAGVEPGQALFVGDTVIDAETAKRAGIDFAAVCNGTTPPEAFREWPNVYIASDLPELQRWLEK